MLKIGLVMQNMRQVDLPKALQDGPGQRRNLRQPAGFHRTAQVDIRVLIHMPGGVGPFQPHRQYARVLLQPLGQTVMIPSRSTDMQPSPSKKWVRSA